MVSIQLEELKNIQLDMLKDIISFCKREKITYYLAYGTLLGAIRHHGYIPWDDDIDICLPRPDYERFISLYSNKEKNYVIVEFRKTSGYGLPFAKVSNENTIMNEFLYKQDTFGIYIDVFPIDAYGSKSQIIKSIWLSKFLNAKKAIVGQGRSIFKNFEIILGKVLLKPIKVRTILNWMHKVATKYDYTSASATEIFCSSTVEREIVSKRIFESKNEVQFEGVNVCVPQHYDEYLTSLYGDYMKLPPIEKQVSHHKFNAYWK